MEYSILNKYLTKTNNMIGNLILWIKNIWKQEFTCIHNYKADRIGIITGLNSSRICDKCGKFENT